MNKNINLSEDVPSKPFSVIELTEGILPNQEHEEQLVEIGVSAQCLRDDYDQAVRRALQESREDGRRRYVQMRQVVFGATISIAEPVKRYASFSTKCPKCKVDGKLAVVALTLTATGQRIERMHSPLEEDGFLVPADVEDASTEEEMVKCGHCKKRFDLSEVTL